MLPNALDRTGFIPQNFSVARPTCLRIGPALLPPLVAQQEGLVQLDLPPVESREVYLVYHRALRQVPSVAAMRAWLVESTGSVLHGLG